MVEMRWLKIDYPPPAGTNAAAIPDSSGRFCRVLQYRYQITTAQGLSIMTAWIDVPTVTEGKNNAG